MIQAFMNLSSIHKQFSMAQGALEAHIKAPSCISCGQCCTTPTCMIIEGINMVSVLTGMGKLKQAVDCAENWLLERRAVAASEMALSYKGLPVGIVAQEMKLEQAQVARALCPFLTDEKKCLIYDCRPMICMARGTTREVWNCSRPPGLGESSTKHLVINSNQMVSAVEAFKQDCGRKPEWRIYGFAPTLLFRAAEPDKFRAMVDDNRIPSAKIIGTEIDINLMWQPEVDAIRRGVDPDLVAAGYTRRPDLN